MLSISNGDFQFIVGLGSYVIFSAVAMSLMFSKAGRPWWHALIPVYNNYALHRIAFDKPTWPFVFLIFVPYVNILYAIYLLYGVAKSFGLGTLGTILYVLFTPFVNIYIYASPDVLHKGTVPHFADSLVKK